MNLTEHQERDVFLSHASEDKDVIVRAFAQELEARKISYWLDEAEIKWGDKITQKINKGLQKSRYVIVFLSESFLGKNWPEAELGSALNRENEQGQTVVLPLLIGDASKIFERYPLLRDKAYLNWEGSVQNLADKLEILLASAKKSEFVKAARDSNPVKRKRALGNRFQFFSMALMFGATVFTGTQMRLQFEEVFALEELLPNKPPIRYVVSAENTSLYDAAEEKIGWVNPGVVIYANEKENQKRIFGKMYAWIWADSVSRQGDLLTTVVDENIRDRADGTKLGRLQDGVALKLHYVNHNDHWYLFEAKTSVDYHRLKRLDADEPSLIDRLFYRRPALVTYTTRQGGYRLKSWLTIGDAMVFAIIALPVFLFLFFTARRSELELTPELGIPLWQDFGKTVVLVVAGITVPFLMNIGLEFAFTLISAIIS